MKVPSMRTQETQASIARATRFPMELYAELSDWSPEILPYEQFPADVM